MPRRDTITVLRARHEAFRVTNDVAHPHLNIEPPPAKLHYVRATKWQDFDALPSPPPTAFLGFGVSDVIAVIVALAAVAGAMLLAVYG